MLHRGQITPLLSENPGFKADLFFYLNRAEETKLYFTARPSIVQTVRQKGR